MSHLSTILFPSSTNRHIYFDAFAQTGLPSSFINFKFYCAVFEIVFLRLQASWGGQDSLKFLQRTCKQSAPTTTYFQAPNPL